MERYAADLGDALGAYLKQRATFIDTKSGFAEQPFWPRPARVHIDGARAGTPSRPSVSAATPSAICVASAGAATAAAGSSGGQAVHRTEIPAMSITLRTPRRTRKGNPARDRLLERSRHGDQRKACGAGA